MDSQNQYVHLTDHELLSLLSENNSLAFRVIYDKYIHDLYRYSRKLHIDSERADDIIQEVFISLWNRKDDLNIENLRSWLYMAVRKKMLYELRKEKYHTKYQESLISFINPFWDPITEQLQAKQLEEFINAEIAKLPPKMREVFILSRQQHLSHKEIAAALSISESTVKKQVNNVLRIFRAKINPHDAYTLFLIGYYLNKK